jgi:hypothetical protein
VSQAVTDLADEPSSLLEWATRLAVDPQLRARLAADPRGLLGEQGFGHVVPADLHHALPLVTDGVAARLGHDVDPGLTGPVEAQHVGEHPLDALARQFAHVSEAVLAGPPAGEADHDLDDPVPVGPHDPTAFLDDLPGPTDLDVAHVVAPHGAAAVVDHHDPTPAVVDVPAHDPGTAEPQDGPDVGNGAVADPFDEPAEHPYHDHPGHADHPGAYGDLHHAADPVEVHLAHDVLDL